MVDAGVFLLMVSERVRFVQEVLVMLLRWPRRSRALFGT